MSDILKSVDTEKAKKELGKNFNPNISGLDRNKLAAKLEEIKKIIFNDKVTIYFVPSSDLRYQISKGENPLLKDMPDSFKALLLEGKGIIIQKMMVYNFLIGKLDKKNSFILSNGDLRIADANYTFISSKKEK